MERKEEKKIALTHSPKGGKEWVARIVGKDSKYGFARDFLPVEKRDWSSSGMTGFTYFVLDEGEIYEINEPYKGRRFVKVENGELIPLSQNQVKVEAEKMEAEAATLVGDF